MGVSVTGDWFNAGFESAVDNARWQVIWRKHAFIEFWADPNNEIWSVPIQSACAGNADNPDRVIFTGVNWEQTAEPWWEEQFEKVIANIEAEVPRRPPHRSADHAARPRQPDLRQRHERRPAIRGRVHRGRGFEAPRPGVRRAEGLRAGCEVFTKGGPHYTDAGMAAVGQIYARHLPMDAAGCACKTKK